MKPNEDRTLQKFLMISHGGTIRNAVRLLLEMKDPGFEITEDKVPPISNASLTVIDLALDRHTLKIQKLDIKSDNSHLSDMVTGIKDI